MSKYSHPQKYKQEQIEEAKRLLAAAPRSSGGNLKHGELDKIANDTGVSKRALHSVSTWAWVKP